MVRDKVLSWCREQGLFAPGETVTAALSGGADSTAMLHLLLSLRRELDIQVRAAHFDHQLRGAESDRDRVFCRDLCRQLNVELLEGGADVAGEAGRTGESLELAARQLRYGFLRDCGGKIATAHTADDQLETVLLNLIRGAALRGLCGIPPVRQSIVRPVLCLTRAEIEAYLQEHDLPHVEDSTNQLLSCRRNRIRHTVVPALLQENPALTSRMESLTGALRQDEALLQSLAGELLDRVRSGDGWRVEELTQAPTPLRRRALRRILEDAGVRDLTQAHLEAAEELLHAGPSASIELPGGAVLRREYGLVCVGAAEAAPWKSFLLPMPGECDLGDGRVLSCRGPFPWASQPGLCLALDRPPLVRPRRTGDRLRLEGGTKTLKKWMIDRKIPAACRGGMPVLELDGTVIAAWGVGVDPEFRPQSGQLCYRLKLKERNEAETDDPSL